MKKHILKIRQVDEAVFEAMRNGKKSVETRAGTDKYREIKASDILIFVCGDKRIERRVKKVYHFKNIDRMVESIDFKKVAPFVDSVEELKKMYYSFPNYEEKIKKFGILAFELDNREI